MSRDGVRRGSTHSLAKHALDELIGKLASDGVRRLPGEDELSEALGYSRPTVRSALLSLQKEGKVQRLHGVGSFINRHALAMGANLAEDRPFLSLLESMGHVPSLRNLSMEQVDVAERDLDRLELSGPQRAICIRRVFEASGRAAVHSVDLVPIAALTADPAEVAPEESTFKFVRRWTDRVVRYSVVDLLAIAADDDVAEALEVPAGSPCIVLDHLHVDADDVPVARTRAYVNDDVLRFSMVRAYLDI